MPGLNEDTSKGTEENLVIGVFEAVDVGAGTKGFLSFEVGPDFVEFKLNFRSAFGITGETGHRGRGISVTTAFDEPTGGLSGMGLGRDREDQ